ncbi:MAG: VOC family protein, partial [Gemmatimonadetes bacterium]|nr:VOC family protein [Gemmatimonadota bacterium]
GAWVEAVGAVGLTVSDLDRSVEFYTGVLTFEIVGEAEVSGSEVDRLQGIFGVRMRVARLRLGDEDIELTEYVTPRDRPAPVEARSNDRWFQHIAIIVRDMDRAYARLREHGVEHVSPEPQRLPDWNPNAGGIEAFYFKDPDGHPLVFGARLRITGLRAAEGPGIEFLEYLSPRDGRPMPADERPNDLIHWQTVLLTRDLETVTDHPSRPSLVSSGPVVLPDTSLGFRKGALIRDPDGHVLLIAEP